MKKSLLSLGVAVALSAHFSSEARSGGVELEQTQFLTQELQQHFGMELQDMLGEPMTLRQEITASTRRVLHYLSLFHQQLQAYKKDPLGFDTQTRVLEPDLDLGVRNVVKEI